MTQNPATILIVDDNPDVSRVISRYLRKAGFEVLQAGDGEAGLRIAQSAHPTMILCDALMPRMTGDQMLAKIKGSSSTAQIPVIIISGTGLADEEQWMSRGASGLLAKPFRFPELIAMIRRVMTSYFRWRP